MQAKDSVLTEIYRLSIEATEQLRKGKPLETEDLRQRAGLPPASGLPTTDLLVAGVTITPPIAAMAPVTQKTKPNIWDEKPGEQGDTITRAEKLDQMRTATPEPVSKFIPTNHRKRGRPRLNVPRQLSMPVEGNGSLRFRAGLMGISAATLLRREREAKNEATN